MRALRLCLCLVIASGVVIVVVFAVPRGLARPGPAFPLPIGRYPDAGLTHTLPVYLKLWLKLMSSACQAATKNAWEL